MMGALYSPALAPTVPPHPRVPAAGRLFTSTPPCSPPMPCSLEARDTFKALGQPHVVFNIDAMVNGAQVGGRHVVCIACCVLGWLCGTVTARHLHCGSCLAPVPEAAALSAKSTTTKATHLLPFDHAPSGARSRAGDDWPEDRARHLGQQVRIQEPGSGTTAFHPRVHMPLLRCIVAALLAP